MPSLRPILARENIFPRKLLQRKNNLVNVLIAQDKSTLKKAYPDLCADGREVPMTKMNFLPGTSELIEGDGATRSATCNHIWHHSQWTDIYGNKRGKRFNSKGLLPNS